MLFALVLAALGRQTPGPVLPPQSSPIFQSAVLDVERALTKGDKAEAKMRLALLPKPAVKVQWDDSKVPASYREEFRKAGAAGLEMWRLSVRRLVVASPTADRNPMVATTSITILPKDSKEKPDIRISFEPTLAKRLDSGLPAGAVGFFSNDPSTPRLDFVIGLSRGKPLKVSERDDVFSDAAYAVGMYFGVADGPFETYSMCPGDLPRLDRTSVSGTEAGAAKANFKAIADLTNAFKIMEPLAPTQPSLFLDPMTLVSEPVTQGDRVEFHIQLSNQGNGTLLYSLSPDCGCTIVSEPGSISAGGTQIAAVAVDTKAFYQPITKHVKVYSNDPVNPVRTVTLKIPIRPRFRVLTPLGDTVIVPPGGLKVPIYLIPAPGSDIDVVSAKFDGMKGNVTFSPWSGVLPDPANNEGPQPRKGYKFVVSLAGNLVPGRSPGTLQMYTTNSDFPDITYGFYGQQGIITIPDDLSLGEVGHVPLTRTFLVSRPGAPFKILGVSTNSPNLRASLAGMVDGDYEVAVEYDGKAKRGDLLAAILIKTNDPKQPLIDMPAHASVQ